MRPNRYALAVLSLTLVVGVGTAVLHAQPRAAAQAEPDQPPPAPMTLTLQCITRGLPVGRAVNVWDVTCTVTGAPADETGFQVWAFGADGRPVCQGDLSNGEGTCSGRLMVVLDEDVGPLTFATRTTPSDETAVDLAPIPQPVRGPR